jgi:hypothetical protein
MRIYSPSDLGESMNGIIRLDRLTIFVAESLRQGQRFRIELRKKVRIGR